MTSQSLWRKLSETPTMQEVGVFGFWLKVIFDLAAVSTPATIIRQLKSTVIDGPRSAEICTSLDAFGMGQDWNTTAVGQEFTNFGRRPIFTFSPKPDLP